MAKIILFILFISCIHPVIIETNRMEEILPYIDESTWVLFDLDDTLLDPEIPSIVQKVQQAAGAVCGLTARAPPVCAATLKQLAYIGIDFTFNSPFCPTLESKPPTHWEGGVLFLTDFNQKGKIFRRWLELSLIRPSKIILVDEGRHHLINMENEMADLGIPCTCFLYTKTLEKPFDPVIAEKESLDIVNQ